MCHEVFSGGSVSYAFTTIPTYPRWVGTLPQKPSARRSAPGRSAQPWPRRGAAMARPPPRVGYIMRLPFVRQL